MQVRTLEVVVPPAHRKNALIAIRDLVKQQHCGLFGALWLRFNKVTPYSLIGNNAASSSYRVNDLAMFIEIEAYTPKGLSPAQFAEYDRFNMDLIKMLIDRFQGRPHWGKGEKWAHLYARFPNSFDGGRQQFKKVLREIDPYGMFASDFTDDLGLTR